jgi:phospholipase/carboxylesterase
MFLTAATLTLALAQTPTSPPPGLRVHEVGGGKRVLLLLHGWGARGDDLVPLAERIAQPGLRIVLPEAPRARKGGGRAWFDPRAGPATEAQVVHARKMLIDLVEGLEEQGVPRRAIRVAGFSQGAIMSLDLALHAGGLGGVGVLSGAPLPIWKSYAGLKGTPVLLAHGRSDGVLSFDGATRLRKALGKAGARVTWLPFDGGHRIPPGVVDALRSFARK